MTAKSPVNAMPQTFGRRDPNRPMPVNPNSSYADEIAIVHSLMERLKLLTIAGEGARKKKVYGDTTKLRRRKIDRETNSTPDRTRVLTAVRRVQTAVLRKLDIEAVNKLSRRELVDQLTPLVTETLIDHALQLNQAELRDFLTLVVNDMIGLGPLEALLADDGVTDIMVNGPDTVYVERDGRLERTNVRFRDNEHVMGIANRIANRVGRRVDETTPYADARLSDGSRVHIITPPLTLRGPTISIRKFSKQTIGLEQMVRQRNMSAAMATILSVAARSRVNILISGGTGSGKTTLLNALSQLIDPGERIITIEDAAELRLLQPHVVPLETRVSNIEGKGEVTIRELVRNALRMRPDRIILGEIRGAEVFDMLQAMNTGHDGALCTIHANKPRDAITRLEHLMAMAGMNLPSKVIRAQIASSVNMIVQVARMRDGVRRVTHIAELTGMENDVVAMHDLFTFVFEELADGGIKGQFVGSGLRPHFTPKARQYGLDGILHAAVS